jgi:hypothetical protein
MGRKADRPEKISGSFSAIPWAVLDSAAFQGLTPRGKAMVFELIRQHNARNNGHFNLAVSTLRNRGWKSTDAIQAAKAELLSRGLMIRTKTGGLNIGPDLYAVTWLPISNFVGLEISSAQYHRGAWRFDENLPAPKKRHSRTPEKRDGHTASRNSTVPPHGMAEASTVPPHGTKTALFNASAIPPHGNNVITNHPAAFYWRVNGWDCIGFAPADYPIQKVALFRPPHPNH